MTGRTPGQGNRPVTRYRRDGRLVTVARESTWATTRRPDAVRLPATRRRNACGITLEVPSTRAWGWNVALVGVQGALAQGAHTVGGLSWVTIGTGLGVVAVLGVVLMTYVVRVHTPRVIRRHHVLLQAHPRAVEVVDRQSTLHHPDTINAPAPHATLMVDRPVSRTR